MTFRDQIAEAVSDRLGSRYEASDLQFVQVQTCEFAVRVTPPDPGSQQSRDLSGWLAVVNYRSVLLVPYRFLAWPPAENGLVKVGDSVRIARPDVLYHDLTATVVRESNRPSIVVIALTGPAHLLSERGLRAGAEAPVPRSWLSKQPDGAAGQSRAQPNGSSPEPEPKGV